MRYFPSFYSLLALLLITSVGCKQIDDLTGGGVDQPAVSYSATTYTADFYQAGGSVTPSIDWNGEQGSVALSSTVEGLSVNSTTGKLEWTKLLPPGTHQVDVIVSNSAGQVVVPVTIENALRGNFVGTYSGSSYYSFDLLSDGTLTFASNSATSPDTGIGTWTLEGDQLIANYVYDLDDSYIYSFRGTVAQTNAAATVVGKWYNGVYDETNSPGGDFELELE